MDIKPQIFTIDLKNRFNLETNKSVVLYIQSIYGLISQFIMHFYEFKDKIKNYRKIKRLIQK